MQGKKPLEAATNTSLRGSDLGQTEPNQETSGPLRVQRRPQWPFPDRIYGWEEKLHDMFVMLNWTPYKYDTKFKTNFQFAWAVPLKNRYQK